MKGVSMSLCCHAEPSLVETDPRANAMDTGTCYHFARSFAQPALVLANWLILPGLVASKFRYYGQET